MLSKLLAVVAAVVVSLAVVVAATVDFGVPLRVKVIGKNFCFCFAFAVAVAVAVAVDRALASLSRPLSRTAWHSLAVA